MNTKEFFFNSGDGESKLHAIKWLPEGEPKAVLQIVHGMAEYVERYTSFAEFMAKQGYLVVGDDHLGHGKSVGENGMKGYFCKEDPATTLVQDEHKLHQIIAGEYPAIPYYILGHSMGSFITRNYLTVYGHEVQAAIIMGTGMMPLPLLKSAKLIAKLQKLLHGEKYPSPLINKLAFGSYDTKIPNRTLENEWLTANLEAVKAYNADENCGFLFTVNGYMALFELLIRLHDEERLDKIPKNLPMLFVAGAKDPVGDYSAGVKRAVDSVMKAGVTNVRMKLYPEGRHEILNDADPQEVYEDILSFLEEQQKG